MFRDFAKLGGDFVQKHLHKFPSSVKNSFDALQKIYRHDKTFQALKEFNIVLIDQLARNGYTLKKVYDRYYKKN